MFWKWLMSAVASRRMFSYLLLVSRNTSIWASSSRSTVLEPLPNLSENICLVHCEVDAHREITADPASDASDSILVILEAKLNTVHGTLYVFMPHFFTLSSFSTATPRATSSDELPALWFEDPKIERRTCTRWTAPLQSRGSQNLSEWHQRGHDGERGGTWMLMCALSKSTGCRLAVRQANAPGFHANVWNEHGDGKSEDEKKAWQRRACQRSVEMRRDGVGVCGGDS